MGRMQLRGGDDEGVVVEQRLEHRLLILELVIHVAGRDARGFGDFTHVGAAISLARKEAESGAEDLRTAAFRAGDLFHSDRA